MEGRNVFCLEPFLFFGLWLDCNFFPYLHSGNKGCFGAKDIDESCYSCEEIRAAYEDKGWHWNVVKFDICMKGKLFGVS